MSTGISEHGLSVHRIDALTDGIYAVAMTLLVIELKLPEHGDADLAHALFELLPKLYAWFISFFVMAFFWMGHHRAHSYLRHVDGPLVWLNVAQLACVSLMPFSCALLGEHASLLAQAIFSINMALLAVFALATLRHVYRHPALAGIPMPTSAYQGARVRIVGLIAVSGLTVLIQWLTPQAWGFGNVAFFLMAVIMPFSRRVERRGAAAAALPVAG